MVAFYPCKSDAGNIRLRRRVRIRLGIDSGEHGVDRTDDLQVLSAHQIRLHGEGRRMGGESFRARCAAR